MIDQPLDTIDEAALMRLIDNQVGERRDLEFKRDLPGGRDDDKKEFLADVTALANSQGGDLIYGIDERDGIAAGLLGLRVDSPDDELLRLENIIRDGVAPRLIGVRMKWGTLASGAGVLVIRIPASLASPHRVIFKNSGKFYSRNSRQKYEMDVHELRHAFTEADQLSTRFRALHHHAIQMARGVDMPVFMGGEPRAIVSVTPLDYFRKTLDLPVVFENAIAPVRAAQYRGFDAIDTLEGVLMHVPVDREHGLVGSWSMTHRTGRADHAWLIGAVRDNGGGEPDRRVWIPRFEECLLEATVSTQNRFRPFNVEGPWVIQATIFGVRNYALALPHDYASRPAFRDRALLGELRVDHIDEAALEPLLRNFWLLFGERRPEGRAIAAR
ncbi:ATP-binding protein [Sphingomonas sp. BGYR3]|uniref:AlbA family DNA-binding domain-containing protein n=1 Tax=Sphingomonas sp. BGYR3 TaxID=2975483 RepID=UPI0021A61402|nr:ATP-binding protein [Sphingomonas sp. BGYR3]MDG5488858.1 ATP-binding protein [Sphingomonas sp. BGYR3]